MDGRIWASLWLFESALPGSRSAHRPLCNWGQAACGLLFLLLAGCATTAEDTAAVIEERKLETVQAAVRLGEVALQQNRFGEAAAHFQDALRQDPEQARAKIGLGEAYLGMGEAEKALATFESDAALGTAATAARQGRGIALLLAGRDDQARDLLLDVVDEDPTLWRAWNALGRYYDRQRDWQKSEESYRRALETNTDAPIVHNNLGFSYLGQGRYEEAVLQFEQALDGDPDLGVARTNLRLALAFLGRYAEALAGVPQSELPRMLNNIGFVAAVLGEHERARAFFQRALEASPSFYEPAWRNLQYLGALEEIDAAPAR